MNTTFEIDCELNYEVFSPSTFVFKIEAAARSEQQIHDESLLTLPSLPLDRHCDALGNRSCRVNVLPGAFSVRYQATVSLSQAVETGDLRECPVESLPLDVLPYLCGSRYIAAELPFATIFGSANMTRMAPLVFRSLADTRAAA